MVGGGGAPQRVGAAALVVGDEGEVEDRECGADSDYDDNPCSSAFVEGGFFEKKLKGMGETKKDQFFDSRLFEPIPESSFPTSSWSVTDDEVEHHEWNRECSAGSDRDDNPCFSAFIEGGFFEKKLKGGRETKKDQFEDDLNELGDGKMAAAAEEGGNEDGDDDGDMEEWIRFSILSSPLAHSIPPFSFSSPSFYSFLFSLAKEETNAHKWVFDSPSSPSCYAPFFFILLDLMHKFSLIDHRFERNGK
ncbi:hypothetical protein COCNU_16G000540 [Cocos nucifera]|uniref:Uncharacterized protein n=1 Tax=Cocos nucifera TaxID=13894 RepID=A0A8K0IXH9_COCNU|nr:hypothetical protein COCNU_16G000540 [Cocos nucifera]